MLKKFLFFMVMIVAFITVGCSPSDENSIELEEQLSIYTTYSDEIIKYIADSFYDETGIKVNYEIVDESTIENIDKDKNIDFILGGDKAIYNYLSSKDLLKPFKASWFDGISKGNKHEDGEWYAVSKNPILLVYNSKNLLSQNAPQSWGNLTNNIYKDNIVMESTNKDYVKNILASLMYPYYKNKNEDAGVKFYQGLKDNVVRFEKNEQNLYKSLNSKDTPIGITTLSSYINNKGNEQNLNVINTLEGSPIVYQCSAILKNAPNPNAAELFMEFVAGPRMQVDLSKEFKIIPTHPDAIKYGGDWMKDISKLKTMDVDLNIILEYRNKWINTFKSLQKDTTNIKEESKS